MVHTKNPKQSRNSCPSMLRTAAESVRVGEPRDVSLHLPLRRRGSATEGGLAGPAAAAGWPEHEGRLVPVRGPCGHPSGPQQDQNDSPTGHPRPRAVRADVQSPVSAARRPREVTPARPPDGRAWRETSSIVPREAPQKVRRPLQSDL